MIGNFFFSNSGAAAGYQIEQSLRFDGSSGFTRTHSNNNTSSDFTLSMWFKKAYNGENNIMLFHTNTDPRYSYVTFGETSGDADQLVARGTSSGYAFNTSRKYRDNSAWYHIVLSVDIGTVTKAYVNGVLDQNTGATSGWYLNGTDPLGLGRTAWGSNYFNGYMAEVHFIDGQALDADSFGEFDNNNGVWRPIEYTGSHGSNGFYLKFDPSATNGIGHDHSGNGNNWTASGFTTSGTGTDVMSDTPTKNFCTFNPLDKDTSTPTNGNLNQPMPGRCAGTIAVNSGKWYWEAQYNAGNGYALGIGVADVDAYYPSEGFSNGIIYYGSTPGDNAGAGIYNFGTTDFSYDNAWSGGRIGIALDLDSATKTITFYRDGTNKGAVTIPSNKHGKYLVPIVQGGSGSTSGSWDLRMQSALWTDSAPAGHKELCTSNLPAPTVKDGSDYFNPVIYAPDGSSSFAVTGVGFQPDLVWVKSRVYAEDHQLNDAVRGATKGLQSNLTNAETTQTNGLTSFDSDGFTVGNLSDYNYNGDSIISWNWKAGGTGAGGTGSSNTDGSITSTVSANPTAGFSIVAYTGNGSNSQTVGHGLGVAPRMCIGKSRASNSWFIRHESLGSNLNLNFNGSGTVTPGGGGLIGDLTSSTTISLPGGSNAGSGNMNANGTNYIMYCFAEIEGYSKFGSYNGNSNNDGPFVYCGFRPAWILLKSTSSGSWELYDTTRDTYNQSEKTLEPNNSAQEASGYPIDILSNGFKVRTSNTQINYSSYSYIFAAFAENPFGGDGVSPATAR